MITRMTIDAEVQMKGLGNLVDFHALQKQGKILAETLINEYKGTEILHLFEVITFPEPTDKYTVQCHNGFCWHDYASEVNIDKAPKIFKATFGRWIDAVLFVIQKVLLSYASFDVRMTAEAADGTLEELSILALDKTVLVTIS